MRAAKSLIGERACRAAAALSQVFDRRPRYKASTIGSWSRRRWKAPRLTLRRLREVLLWAAPGVLLIASLGGYWISRRALAPVDAITRAAQSIGIENLSQRLEVPAAGDELARLSETWNGMLERLEARREALVAIHGRRIARTAHAHRVDPRHGRADAAARALQRDVSRGAASTSSTSRTGPRG